MAFFRILHNIFSKKTADRIFFRCILTKNTFESNLGVFDPIIFFSVGMLLIHLGRNSYVYTCTKRRRYKFHRGIICTNTTFRLPHLYGYYYSDSFDCFLLYGSCVWESIYDGALIILFCCWKSCSNGVQRNIRGYKIWNW